MKLAGVDLIGLDEEAMRGVRGKDIAMIFQEPMTSLNPVLTIGSQIAEAVLLHEPLSRAQAWQQAIDMLRLVRISEPEQRAKAYPHQLSGGMRQRAMIAMALACHPNVLIADEPTTALDVTIQAQILAIILELQRELGTAVILITHDLGVVAETAQRVIVMYAGRKVEEASVEDLFAHPQHPYTRGLMASIPRLALMRGDDAETGGRLQEIPGMVPALSNLPDGCVFAPRCAFAQDRCRAGYPVYEEKRPRPLGGLLALAGDFRGPRWLRRRDDPTPPVLEVRDLKQHFAISHGFLRRAGGHVFAVDGVSFYDRSRARRSGWWASPAAASRRSDARSCG